VRGLATPGPARRLPGQQPEDLVHGRRGARCQPGERGDGLPPGLRRAGAFRLGGEGVDRPVPVVTLPDQAGLAGHREPGTGQGVPALRDAQRPPQVVGAGRQEDLVDPAGGPADRHRTRVARRVRLAHQARRVGDLQQQRGRGLVHRRRPGQPLEVPDAQAAGLEDRGGLAGQRLEQRLGVADRFHHLPGARRVDRLHVPDRRLRGGRRRPQHTQRAGVATQQQPHLARQLDQLTVGDRGPARLGDRDQDVVLYQPAHRLGHRSGVERADRGSGGEPVQHRAGGRRRGQHGPAQPRLVRTQGRGLGVQIVGGTAQTGRVRRGHLVHRGDHVQRVLRAVQQEPGPQPVDRRPDVPGGCAHGHGRDRVDRGQRGLRGAAEPGRVEDPQGELVQGVQAAGDRAAGLGAHGQRGEVGGYGHDEVRAQLDERAQGLVGKRPELVGECGGHRGQR
jgi:hypothetical protein